MTHPEAPVRTVPVAERRLPSCFSLPHYLEVNPKQEDILPINISACTCRIKTSEHNPLPMLHLQMNTLAAVLTGPHSHARALAPHPLSAGDPTLQRPGLQAGCLPSRFRVVCMCTHVCVTQSGSKCILSFPTVVTTSVSPQFSKVLIMVFSHDCIVFCGANVLEHSLVRSCDHFCLLPYFCESCS